MLYSVLMEDDRDMETIDKIFAYGVLVWVAGFAAYMAYALYIMSFMPWQI